MKKLLALITLGMFSVSTGVVAGTCNGEFGWLGKGTAFGLAEGDFIFTGEFSGALFNTDTSDPTHKATVQCPGLWHVEGGEGKSQGVCILKMPQVTRYFSLGQVPVLSRLLVDRFK